MRYFILSIIFLISSISFSQYFPTYIKTYAPGIDFEQERNFYKYQDLPMVFIEYFSGNLWLLNPKGIFKLLLDENLKIDLKEEFDIFGEAVAAFSYEDYLLLVDNACFLYLFKSKGNSLELTQRVENFKTNKIIGNSSYIINFFSSDYIEIYAFNGNKITLLNGHLYNFTKGFKEIGFGEENYFYLAFPEDQKIINGIVAHNILDPSTLQDFVYLEGLESFVKDGIAYKEYLYLLSEYNDNYYFSIYKITEDPLEPKLISKISLNGFKPKKIILNKDRTKVLLFEDSLNYLILDISNYQNISIGNLIESDEDFEKFNLIYVENKIFFIDEDLNLRVYEQEEPISGKFILKDKSYSKTFKFADIELLHNEKFIELFMDQKKFYLYNLDPQSEEIIKFEKEIPFPPCPLDYSPHTYGNSFDFDGENIVFQSYKKILLTNLNGNYLCMDYQNYIKKVYMYNKKLFVLTDKIEIYNIEDMNNYFLEKVIERDASKIFIVNNKYLITFSNYIYEVWNYEGEPFVSYTLSPISNNYFFDLKYFKDNWFYFGIENKAYEQKFFSLFPHIYSFHLTEDGKFEWTPPVPFNTQNLAESSFPYLKFNDYKYIVADIKDSGKPRISDLRAVPGKIHKIYSNENFLIFKTGKGYEIFNPYGTTKPEELAFGWVDFPKNKEIIEENIIEISGWAIDPKGESIENILIELDKETLWYKAFYGFPRPDVAEKYSEYGNSYLSGFYGALDISNLNKGWHSLTVIGLKNNSQDYYSFIGTVYFYKK